MIAMISIAVSVYCDDEAPFEIVSAGPNALPAPSFSAGTSAGKIDAAQIPVIGRIDNAHVEEALDVVGLLLVGLLEGRQGLVELAELAVHEEQRDGHDHRRQHAGAQDEEHQVILAGHLEAAEGVGGEEPQDH